MKFEKLVINLLLEIWENIYKTRPGVVYCPRDSRLYKECQAFLKQLGEWEDGEE